MTINPPFSLFITNISDLIELQHSSFYSFLITTLKLEFLKLSNPYLYKYKLFPHTQLWILIYFYSQKLNFNGPTQTIYQCLETKQTYDIMLNIPLEYLTLFHTVYKTPKNGLTHLTFPFHTILSHVPLSSYLNLQLGKFPLMTSEGTFVINGYERLLMTQIIRSPGVYFSKEYHVSTNTEYYIATLISKGGLWTKFIFNPHLSFIESLKIFIPTFETETIKKLSFEPGDEENNGNISLLEICFYFGLTYQELCDTLSPLVNDLSHLETIEIACHEFLTTTSADHLLMTYYLNCLESRFFMGQLGRYKLNQSLGVHLPLQIESLTTHDFLQIIKKFICFHETLQTNDNIDDLKHKHLKSVGDFFQTFVALRLKQIHQHFTCKVKPSILFNTLTPIILKRRLVSQNEAKVPFQTYFKMTYPDLITTEVPTWTMLFCSPVSLLQIHDLFRHTENISRSNVIFSIEGLFCYILNALARVFHCSFQSSVTQYIQDIWSFTNGVLRKNLLETLQKYTFSNDLQVFFMISELSQFLDQTNVLADVTHKRKISTTGPLGLSATNANLAIRDIHPNFYGRICPVTTPDGKNAGLVSTLALYSRNTSLGLLTVPYFYLNKLQLNLQTKPVYLNANQEKNVKIGASEISLQSNTVNLKATVATKVDVRFEQSVLETVNFLTISPIQIIALGIALIPFFEHNDANRALMGATMQRQAMPLKFLQAVLVGTGWEPVTTLGSNLVIKNYTEGRVLKSTSQVILIADRYTQKVLYYLNNYSRSNQNTFLKQTAIVWNGEWVFKDQIIADNTSTKNSEIALGKNLLIAYMSWEGYNYEDAIIINEKLIFNNILTSIQMFEYSLTIPLQSILTHEPASIPAYFTRHLNKEGIIRLGAYVLKNDLLLGLMNYQLENIKSPKLKKLLQPGTFYISNVCHSPFTGCLIDVRYSCTAELTLYFYFAQTRKIQIGDKLSGRHGNKGVISRILPMSDMPYLPDGTTLDILLNPLGVPSRMNVGQIFECLLGFASERLEQRCFINPFDEIYGPQASRILILQKLKEAALISKQQWIFSEHFPGKVLLRDGRTGEFFDNPITIGRSYILKLIHLVEDKSGARSLGTYSAITEQPMLGGVKRQGGQRLGEMEVWALEAYSANYLLQEFLTLKADDIDSRREFLKFLELGDQSFIQFETSSDFTIPSTLPYASEAFFQLLRYLNALGLEITLGQMIDTSQMLDFPMLFSTLEERLILNSHLI